MASSDPRFSRSIPGRGKSTSSRRSVGSRPVSTVPLAAPCRTVGPCVYALDDRRVGDSRHRAHTNANRPELFSALALLEIAEILWKPRATLSCVKRGIKSPGAVAYVRSLRLLLREHEEFCRARARTVCQQLFLVS